MKKTYLAPGISAHTVVCEHQLMALSLKVGGKAVDSSNDIGFAKENTNTEDGEFWDHEW